MPVKRIIGLVLVFIVSAVIFIVALMPASVALEAVRDKLPPELQLGEASGTVWQGQIAGVVMQNYAVSTLKWQLQPWKLLTGKLGADVTLGKKRNPNELSATTEVTWGLFNQHLALKNTKARLKVSQAIEMFSLPVPTEAKGRIFLNVTEYQLGSPYCEALAGEITTPDLEVKGREGWFQLGELSGDLACKQGAVAMKIDPNNLLGLQADIKVAQGNQLSVTGFIKPDASLPQDVHQAVQFLGRQDSQGRYKVNF